MAKFTRWRQAKSPLNAMEHALGQKPLFFEPVGKFFDDWIGEHVLGNLFDLSLGAAGIEGIVEGNDEVFSLPNVPNAFILHLLERTMDGLSLRIQDRGLQRDVDMSLHCDRL